MSKTLNIRIFEGPRKKRYCPSNWTISGHREDISLKLGVEPDDLDRILNIKKKKR